MRADLWVSVHVCARVGVGKPLCVYACVRVYVCVRARARAYVCARACACVCGGGEGGASVCVKRQRLDATQPA